MATDAQKTDVLMRAMAEVASEIRALSISSMTQEDLAKALQELAAKIESGIDDAP